MVPRSSKNAGGSGQAKKPAACGLNDYIKKHFGDCQSDFAAAQGVAPAQVTQWLKKGFIVVDDVLHSPRRELSRPTK